ncbi:helix-turn-helix transcriptional regulator [Paenibacillus daejeonensis]|uniref:helix-turn-helix transcriptional regulator n=1 Tax=Paenibacillus daejeonensis TaxID=135193 RepID=UPI00036724EE|nr:YafY family protein [Paenibacillus daejeonensis]
MSKLERLISIVMILLQQDVMSAASLASIFGVSKRTILRDMETLGLSNIPIYAVHGVNGGYGIMNSYKLDKRLLNHTDLQNVLIALSGLEQLLVSEDVESTLKKIEAMVNSVSHKGVIQLSFYEWEGRSDMLPTLSLCQEAIMQSRLVSFDYLDRNGVATNRKVEPYRLHFSERSWYLRGFCLERKAYRTFKLSRTDHCKLEVTRFVPREDSSEQMAEADYSSRLVEVKARITPRIKEQFIERYGRKCIDDSNPESLIATIHVPQNEDGFRFLAGFGKDLKIITPLSYQEQFKAFLMGMVEVYG